MSLSSSSFARLVPVVILCALAAVPVWAACGTTTFTPNRLAGNGSTYQTTPSTHNALYVTDPANQQVAVFDMEWGGQLASLKYSPSGNVLLNPQAQELIWGHDPGAMQQSAYWVDNSWYNPTPAGDNGHAGDWGRGSVLYGAACKNDSMLLIMTTTTEFSTNDANWAPGGNTLQNVNWARAAMIYHGTPRDDMWLTPYALTMTVTFVPNPAGTPAYYLKQDIFLHSTDVQERFNGVWWNFGVYAPGTTDPPVDNYNVMYDVLNGANSFHYSNYSTTCGSVCTGSQKVMAGLYPTADFHQGVAVSVNGGAWLNGLGVRLAGPGWTNFWNNNSIGVTIDGTWSLSPGAGRRFIGHVLAGDWSNAQAFNPQ